MTKPSSGTTTDRRVRKVEAELATEIGDKHKVSNDVVERAVRSFDDYEAAFEAALAPQTLSGETWPPYLRTEAEKRVAGSFGKALNKLESWFAGLESRSDAPLRLAVLQRVVYGDAAEFFEWKEQLTRWRQHFEACAGQGKEKRGLFFTKRDNSKSQKFVLHRKAAEQSATILVAHGIPLAATPKRGESKASILIRVAEIILGDRLGNVVYECRKLVARRKAIKDCGRKSRNRASK
jgi:hypothetical protein